MQRPEQGLADGIRKFGFRKWYERQLLSGHAHMVLGLLSVVGLLGAMEAAHGATPADQAMDAGIVLLCAGLALWAIRRYLYLLMHAEAVADQATCPACGTYGRLRLVDTPPAHGETPVCCTRCEHRWTMHG